MPTINGLEAAAALRTHCPKVRVVILSMYGNPEYVRQALQAGAVGYLLKKSAVEELETAIRQVACGQTCFSASLSGTGLTADPRDGPTRPEPPASLSQRQLDVLRLIAASKNTKEIALFMGVSPKTVEFHRAALMRRLGIPDIPGLVRYAIRIGLVAPGP
jgi:DNA-binding NarL/FixJ family response regulator